MTTAYKRHTGALLTLIAVTVGVLLVDQLSKAWAVTVMAPRMAAGDPPIALLGDWLALTFYENPGASFGIGSGFTWIFTAIALGVVIAIIRVARKLASVPWAIALGGLLGGAIGNLADRLFRPPSFGQGHVIDFIAFGDFFVNNIADIALSASVVLILVLMLAGIDVDGTRMDRGDDGDVEGHAAEASTDSEPQQ